MVEAWLHLAVTDKLGDGRVVGKVGRLTFIGRGDLPGEAFFH